MCKAVAVKYYQPGWICCKCDHYQGRHRVDCLDCGNLRDDGYIRQPIDDEMLTAIVESEAVRAKELNDSPDSTDYKTECDKIYEIKQRMIDEVTKWDED